MCDAKPSMKPLRLFVIALAVPAIAGCAGPQVRLVGNGDGPSAYELRGQRLADLQAEAARLCADGYRVLRQGQRFARPEPHDNAATQWLQQAGDWLSGMPGNEAQATIVCLG